MKFFLSVLGMVMILEGLPYFAFPEGIKRWLVKVSWFISYVRRYGSRVSGPEKQPFLRHFFRIEHAYGNNLLVTILLGPQP
jgi:uncharacterized protein YjeT (DUF2065 family)